MNDRLRLSRVARGLSQESLANLAGVTRQAISGIESGRFSPSLDVALALAGALGASVEDLFGGGPPLGTVEVRIAGGARAPRGRLLLAEVGDVTFGYPLAGDGALVPGFRPALAEADGDQARRLAAPTPTVAVAGCDPALALLEGPLRRHVPPVSLVWHPCGNDAARRLLEEGAVHAAALHYPPDETPPVGDGTAVVGFAAWREGLVVSPAHAAAVRSLADAVRLGLRLANREPGSEARRLLDRRLAAEGVRGNDLAGHGTMCTAHLLVASAIAAGLADVGVASEPAALAYGLAFVPWQDEICELHLPRALLATTEVRALTDVLGGRELVAQLGAIPGYGTHPLGRVREGG